MEREPRRFDRACCEDDRAILPDWQQPFHSVDENVNAGHGATRCIQAGHMCIRYHEQTPLRIGLSISLRRSSSSCLQVSLAAFHKVQESSGQFTNSGGLMKTDCFPGDQFTAYAESDSSS